MECFARENACDQKPFGLRSSSCCNVKLTLMRLRTLLLAKSEWTLDLPNDKIATDFFFVFFVKIPKDEGLV